MAKTVYVTAEVMEQLAHRLAVAFFAEYNEPLPDFSQHDKALLDSALALPRATYGSKDLYPTLSSKAAIMFYGIIKNHPFPNGNKRLATATVLVFLYLNGYWIMSEQEAIYTWAITVAQSDAHDRDTVVAQLTDWFNTRITTKRRAKRAMTGRLDIFVRVWSLLGWLVPGYWRRRRTKK